MAGEVGSGSAAPVVFSWPVRIYYEDTDFGGVVYYANYLKYMERARTEWLRSLGFEQTVLARQWNVLFVVRSVSIEYLLPARFNDALAVSVESPTAKTSQLIVAQSVSRDTQALVTAQIRLVCVDTRSFRPVRIPSDIISKIA